MEYNNVHGDKLLKAAIGIASSEQDASSRCSLFVKIIEKAIGTMSGDDLDRLINDARVLSMAVESDSHKLLNLAEVGACLLKRGRNAEAFALFDCAVNIAKQDRSITLRYGGLYRIISELANAGFFEQAIKVVDVLPGGKLSGLVMLPIVLKYIEGRNLSSAIELVGRIHDGVQRKEMLIAIIFGIIEHVDDPKTQEQFLSRLTAI